MVFGSLSSLRLERDHATGKAGDPVVQNKKGFSSAALGHIFPPMSGGIDRRSDMKTADDTSSTDHNSLGLSYYL